jgi:hypothetical protein
VVRANSDAQVANPTEGFRGGSLWQDVGGDVRRCEVAQVCSKVYGVTHKNRVSSVDVITKEDALGFIEDHN